MKKCGVCGTKDVEQNCLVMTNTEDINGNPIGIMTVAICGDCIGNLAKQSGIKTPLFGVNRKNAGDLTAKCLHANAFKSAEHNVKIKLFSNDCYNEIADIARKMGDFDKKVSDDALKASNSKTVGAAAKVADAYTTVVNAITEAHKTEAYKALSARREDLINKLLSSAATGELLSLEKCEFIPSNKYMAAKAKSTKGTNTGLYIAEAIEKCCKMDT